MDFAQWWRRIYKVEPRPFLLVSGRPLCKNTEKEKRGERQFRLGLPHLYFVPSEQCLTSKKNTDGFFDDRALLLVLERIFGLLTTPPPRPNSSPRSLSGYRYLVPPHSSSSSTTTSPTVECFVLHSSRVFFCVDAVTGPQPCEQAFALLVANNGHIQFLALSCAVCCSIVLPKLCQSMYFFVKPVMCVMGVCVCMYVYIYRR